MMIRFYTIVSVVAFSVFCVFEASAGEKRCTHAMLEDCLESVPVPVVEFRHAKLPDVILILESYSPREAQGCDIAFVLRVDTNAATGSADFEDPTLVSLRRDSTTLLHLVKDLQEMAQVAVEYKGNQVFIISRNPHDGLPAPTPERRLRPSAASDPDGIFATRLRVLHATSSTTNTDRVVLGSHYPVALELCVSQHYHQFLVQHPVADGLRAATATVERVVVDSHEPISVSIVEDVGGQVEPREVAAGPWFYEESLYVRSDTGGLRGCIFARWLNGDPKALSEGNYRMTVTLNAHAELADGTVVPLGVKESLELAITLGQPVVDEEACLLAWARHLSHVARLAQDEEAAQAAIGKVRALMSANPEAELQADASYHLGLIAHRLDLHDLAYRYLHDFIANYDYDAETQGSPDDHRAYSQARGAFAEVCSELAVEDPFRRP